MTERYFDVVEAGQLQTVVDEAIAPHVDDNVRHIYKGRLAARPAAGVADRFYWAVGDLAGEGVIYRDTGVVWEVFAVRSWTDLRNKPTAGDIGGVMENTRNQANGFLGLNAQTQIDPVYLPALAIDSVNRDITSDAQMTALVAEPGDVAIRTDYEPDRMYMLAASPASTLANWVRVTFGDVVSVNGQTGVVTLGASNVSALGRVRDKGVLLAYGSEIDFQGNGVITDTYEATPGDPTTRRIRVAISGAAAGMASDAAAGIVRLDSPATDPANPYVYPRSSPVFAPHVQGLEASVSGGALSVSPGSAYIPGLRRIVDAPSAITVSSGGLTADTLYHLYLYVDGSGVPQIEASTVAAVGLETSGLTNPSGFPLRGGARVKGPASGPDYTRRLIGAARLTTGGVWLAQRPVGGGIVRYVAEQTGFSGNATVATTISLAHLIPAGASVLARVSANGSNSAFFGIPGTTGEISHSVTPPSEVEEALLLDEARSLTYRVASASFSVFLTVHGYVIRR